ncbi:DinB family protein [Luteipulveratus halotolerans]|uniref:Mini-circle protein n=1 Tax=Luteipulveratus halotolerans TaxID=1631356 RepID=A0A0L6CLY9_9MICO|nr:DinB family protein [Luteipulveratus halotolerans]KNX38650.1 hypothetical protein VV01_18285 [Luteipulveratus halotolerans]
MTATVEPVTAERAALEHFLDAQRAAVVDIVEGLDEAGLARTTVPSGWTPDSLLRHLSGAEYYWFGVVMGVASNEKDDAFTAADQYRAQVAASVRAIRDMPLDTPTSGPVVDGLVDEVTTLRGVILHMIEETARHAGHLDIARELIDGQTGRGPR